MNITLYNYWRSSASHRVRIALHAKRLPFKYVPVNLLTGEQRSAMHRGMNPSGYVPALEVDGKVAFESIAIIELLEELAPEIPLYPRDPWERVRVRSIVEIINSGIQPLHNLNVLQHLSPDDKARADWAKHFIAKGLAAVEQALELAERSEARGRFALGDAFTAADVCIVPQLHAARRYGVDLTPFPRVERAGKEAVAMDFVQAAAPENQIDAPKA